MMRRLASPKLAAWLIGVLILMTLLSVLLPQKSYMGAQFADFSRQAPVLASIMTRLGLDRVFWGWPIVVVAALLALNVGSCMLRRIQSRQRPPSLAVSRNARNAALSSAEESAEYLERASEELSSHGYEVLSSSEEGLVASAGSSGFWGSMVLHASLLVLIVGGIASALTSFQGDMYITEGQTVTDTMASYTAITRQPPLGQPFTGTSLTLASTSVGYEKGVLVSAIAKLRAVERSGRTVSKDVRVNHPLDVAGKSYLIRDSGYAVELAIAPTGATAETVVVNLADETSRGWRDSMALGAVAGHKLTLEMTATPVPLGEDQVLPPDKYELKDPRLTLTVLSDGAPVWNGLLAEGESTPSGPPVVVTFRKLILWDHFLVRGDPLRSISYAGFWFAILGSAWRFAVPERRIYLAVRRDAGTATAYISLRSRPWSGFAARSDAALTDRILALADSSDGVPCDSPDATIPGDEGGEVV